MADKSIGRSERKTAATRAAIIDAAERLLRDGGPEAVTLQAVSDLADVAVQTIYNRVGGRESLLLSVAERAMQANHHYLDGAYAEPGRVVDRMRRVAAGYLQFARERPHEFRLLMDPPDDPATIERIATLAEQQTGRLAQTLRDGIADGTVRPDLDPDVVAKILWAMLDGVISLAWRADLHRTDPASLLPVLDTIVSDGLVNRDADPTIATDRSVHP